MRQPLTYDNFVAAIHKINNPDRILLSISPDLEKTAIMLCDFASEQSKHYFMIDKCFRGKNKWQVNGVILT
jgi:hypothetical protein